MSTIPLTEATVDAHFELMTNPQKYNLKFRPLEECFEVSETVTAQHILFKDYAVEVPMCPKVFFYIVMEKVYGRACEKDTSGLLGFKLKFKPKTNPNMEL